MIASSFHPEMHTCPSKKFSYTNFALFRNPRLLLSLQISQGPTKQSQTESLYCRESVLQIRIMGRGKNSLQNLGRKSLFSAFLPMSQIPVITVFTSLQFQSFSWLVFVWFTFGRKEVGGHLWFIVLFFLPGDFKIRGKEWRRDSRKSNNAFEKQTLVARRLLWKENLHCLLCLFLSPSFGPAVLLLVEILLREKSRMARKSFAMCQKIALS